MYRQNKYYPINWVDGMKISSSNFIEWDEYIYEALRDLRATFGYDHAYGLLPSNSASESYPLIEVNKLPNQVQVKLLDCQAITPAGQRIDVNREQINEELRQFDYPTTVVNDLAVGQYDVYISCEGRAPNGNSIETGPPRRKFLMPEVKLNLTAGNNSIANQQDTLKIAEIIVDVNGTVGVNRDFIPACFVSAAHPKFLQTLKLYEEQLSYILNIAPNLINNSRAVMQNNHFAANVYYFCNNILFAIGSVFDKIRLTSKHQAPTLILSEFVNIARLIYLGINCIPYQNQFFNENYPQICSVEVPEGNFYELSQGVLGLSLNPHQLDESTRQVSLFLKALQLWFRAIEEKGFAQTHSGATVF